MPAAATSFPSGLNATPSKPWLFLQRVPISVPVPGSQSLTVLSQLALTSDFPSGLKAAATTRKVWPAETSSRMCCFGSPSSGFGSSPWAGGKDWAKTNAAPIRWSASRLVIS